MLAAGLIVFREVFEAGLVIGIVLSATRGVAGSLRAVALGILAGLAGACLVAVFAGVIGDALQGSGQEVLNGTVLLVACGMLGWHMLWMATHGREMAAEMRALGRDVREGSRTLLALAVVVGVAVLREGAEVVLFLYGLVVGGEGWLAMSGGIVAGLVGGSVVAGLLYLGLVAIPTKRLFAVTNALLAFLAAGMASQGVGFLIQADLVPPLVPEVWDSSAVLDEKSMVGRALHALVGYSDRPAGIQLLTYAVVLAVLLLGSWAITRGARRAATAR